MLTEYRVTVNETAETQTFTGETAMLDSKLWIERCKRTLGVFGGEPTFTLVKITYERIDL